MPWIIGGAALVGGGLSFLGGKSQSKQTANAAKESNAIQREALGLQREAMTNARADLAPYNQAGLGGLAGISAASGAQGPEAYQQAVAQFQQSPGYQWQFNEGMRATNAGAAAQGMSNSGATLKALQERGQQLANQDFSQYYNRLAGLAQLGQNAAAGVGSMGIQSANAQGNILGNMAQTAASLGTAQANITGNMYQGIGNAVNTGLNNYMMMNALYRPQTAATQRAG